MSELPITIYTSNALRVRRTRWRDVENGDTVYLYAKIHGKETAIGPFTVINKDERQLIRDDKVHVRNVFYHYPEELYVVDKGD